MKKFIKRICLVLLAILIIGFLLPQNLQMPVDGANDHSYNPKTFWYEGWGTSVVHKGIDVFAKRGTTIHSATYGLVIANFEYGKGGKFVVVLGPKWRLHYYAHMDQVKTSLFRFVTKNSIIGTVGNSGNASTTPSHLHYGIATIIPYPWRIDNAPLGWQKMFYLNPIDYVKGKPSHIHTKNNKRKEAKSKSLHRSQDLTKNIKLPLVKEGDIIFQTSQSSQSTLIQKATQSPLSHCGIVVKTGNELKVLEASNVVKLTSLAAFINKGKNHKYWIKKSKLNGKTIQYQQYLGKRYDLAFKFDNDKYYCSELIYYIYKDQFGIELCTPRPVKDYHIEGLNKILTKRGIDINQLVVAPSDLY